MLLNSSKKNLIVGRKQVRNQYMDRNLKRLGLGPILYMDKFPCKFSREIYILLAKEFKLETVTGQAIDKNPELIKIYDEVLKEIFGSQIEVKAVRENNDYILTRTSTNFRTIIGNHGSALYKRKKDLWELICLRKQDVNLENVIVTDPADPAGSLVNCSQYFPDQVLYIEDMMVQKNVHTYKQVNFSFH